MMKEDSLFPKITDFDQLKNYAEDLNRVYQSEKQKREELEAAYGKLKDVEDELRKHQKDLEELVDAKTRDLHAAQDQLVEKAMESGRAQLSAIVLHNIGNTMTPIKVYVEEIKNEEIKQIVMFLEKCYEDIMDHQGDLQNYLTNDSRGSEILSFLGELIQSLGKRDENRSALIGKLDAAVADISDMLKLQQIYAASEESIKVQTDLNSVIEDALKTQRNNFKKNGINLTLNLCKNIPKLLIDQSRLIQVIVNLINNSFKGIENLAKSDKKKLISIKSFRDEGHAGFSISDNGIGMDHEQLNHVFDAGVSWQGKLGYGLSYCKMFVEANNGKISIKSDGIGKGAIAEIVFKA